MIFHVKTPHFMDKSGKIAVKQGVWIIGGHGGNLKN